MGRKQWKTVYFMEELDVKDGDVNEHSQDCRPKVGDPGVSLCHSLCVLNLSLLSSRSETRWRILDPLNTTQRF